MSETDPPKRARAPRKTVASAEDADAPVQPKTPVRRKPRVTPETDIASPRKATPRKRATPAADGEAAVASAATSPAAPRKPRTPPAAKREPAPTDAGLPSFLRGRRGAMPAPPRVAPNGAHPADATPRSIRTIDRLLTRVPDAHRERVRSYLALMRIDRPVGALLLLWPTWWALWFAAGDFPPPGLLVIFTLGVFVMRSAGCVINDYADHDWLDANVERTRARPMAAGRVSRKEALLLFAALLGVAFVLVLFTNALTIKLSLVGAALAIVYPFTKRVTHLAQVVLGAAFGWSIPMAFAAVTGELPPLAWLLFLANVLFSTIYDTEYAMVDRDEDIRVGAKSTAILFGDADRPILGVLMATFLFAMLLAGTRAELGWAYFCGLAVAVGLFAWQFRLIRDRSREHCFAAFRNNNWVGFALWLGLLLALAMR